MLPPCAINTATSFGIVVVTIEKWYTACGGQHPAMAGPDCDVEKAMFATFGEIKAVNPNVTTIMYLQIS